MLIGMNEDVFWRLIEDCRPTGPDPDAERLTAVLKLPLDRGHLETGT
jgi:hypothetical protein